MARKTNAVRIVDDEFFEPSKPKVVQKNNSLKLRIDDLKTIDPLTENQQKFFECYKRGDEMILLHGSAGTGKTYCAVYKALEQVMDKSYHFKKLVIVRSAVASRDMGFLPGDIDEKMDIYQQPYKQICENLFGRKDAYQRLVEQGYIEFVSTSYVRGCTWDDCIVIVDEMQNLTWPELSTITTRLGNRSKIMFSGDFRQTDLKKYDDKSGLDKFLNVCSMMGASRIEFTVDDIVRSNLVKNFIIATMKYEDKER